MEGKLSPPSCCEGVQSGTQNMGIVEWQVGIGSGWLLHQRPSPIAGGEQGFCWTPGCRQDPLQSDTGVSPALMVQNCLLPEMKWPSQEVTWAHTQPPGASFKGLLLLTASASCEISHHALAECFEAKGRIWFNPVWPIFSPCVLDYRFPLKVNMIFLFSQQSVLQREVCCLFTSSNGESEIVWPQLGHSTPGAAVIATASPTGDEAGTAQGGTNEVWRGQGPYLRAQYAQRVPDIGWSVSQVKCEQFCRYLCFKCRIIFIPLSNRLENALQTLSMGASRHTALYCHQILKMGRVGDSRWWDKLKTLCCTLKKQLMLELTRKK